MSSYFTTYSSINYFLAIPKPAAAIKAQHVVLQLPGGSAMHFECVDAERFAVRAMLEPREAA